MKKIILPLAGLLIATGTFFTSCDSASKNIEDAKQDVVKADANLEQARIDSAAEYNKMMAEWTTQLATNEKTLADLKIKIALEKKEVQSKYDQQLDALQEKNNEMKEQMNNMTTVDSYKWGNFKKDLNAGILSFNADVTSLGKAILEIGKK